ncbi:elongator complex protein 6 [Cylas formicarius]|uniref:elongator complex protein 6 n=1 Tax=Cylas formicarius TaxID=197179 RepID=UPI0029589821|nr:elongator complex protein 6 [Cylas formicarius]
MISLSDPRLSNPVLSVLKVQPTERIISIRENADADSSFVISHLLKQILYERHRACLVTLHNDFNHYYHVGKKLGYDLRRALETDDLKVIDPLSDIVDGIGEIDADPDFLKRIFMSIKCKLEGLASSETHRAYLIVDDLSHFWDLGIEIAHIVTFVNCCANMVDSNVSLILGTHVGSENDRIISNTLEYIGDVHVVVSPLKTGKSGDVTGTLDVQRVSGTDYYHFRTFDRGVKTFHPGESIYHMYK